MSTMMRIALVVVTLLWVAIFAATIAGADVFGSVYVPIVHQGLLLFAVVMAAVVPNVFVDNLRQRKARSLHYAAICAWALFLFSIYHEVVLQKAFE